MIRASIGFRGKRTFNQVSVIAFSGSFGSLFLELLSALHRNPNLIGKLCFELNNDSRPLDKVYHIGVIIRSDSESFCGPPLIDFVDIILVRVLLRFFPFEVSHNSLAFEVNHLLFVNIPFNEVQVEAVNQVDNHYQNNHAEKQK
jgi:hypothetical protein